MLRFKLRLLHGGGTYKKKLDLKTWPLSGPNRTHKSCYPTCEAVAAGRGYICKRKTPMIDVDLRVCAIIPVIICCLVNLHSNASGIWLRSQNE